MRGEEICLCFLVDVTLFTNVVFPFLLCLQFAVCLLLQFSLHRLHLFHCLWFVFVPVHCKRRTWHFLMCCRYRLFFFQSSGSTAWDHFNRKPRFLSMEEYFLQIWEKLPVKGLRCISHYTPFSLRKNFKSHIDPRPRLNTLRDESKNCSLRLNDPASFMTFRHFLSAGVVPEPKGKMEEKRAFWSNAAGPNTFLNSLRAASSGTSWELRTGTEWVL